MERTLTFEESQRQQITQILERIAIALEAQNAMNGQGPEWEYPIETLNDFPWPKVGATVVSTDKDGIPNTIEWCGHYWTRQKLGDDQIYSRPVGRISRAILAVFYNSPE